MTSTNSDVYSVVTLALIVPWHPDALQSVIPRNDKEVIISHSGASQSNNEQNTVRLSS